MMRASNEEIKNLQLLQAMLNNHPAHNEIQHDSWELIMMIDLEEGKRMQEEDIRKRNALWEQRKPYNHIWSGS